MKYVKTRTKYLSVSTLKKHLWTVFSIFIRTREANEYELTKCFTCGKLDRWQNMDAGHYIPKSVGGANLYFNEKNVHAQCTGCNRFRHGNLHIYALRLREKYGDGILEWLEAYRKDATKYNPAELTILINHYKKLNAARNFNKIRTAGI